jgi:hypothetical protein
MSVSVAGKKCERAPAKTVESVLASLEQNFKENLSQDMLQELLLPKQARTGKLGLKELIHTVRHKGRSKAPDIEKVIDVLSATNGLRERWVHLCCPGYFSICV